MSKPAEPAEPAEPSGALERGLAVLRLLAADPARRMRATDVVRATGLARSVVDRILATLVRLGYLRADDRDVRITPHLMELGDAYLSCSGLPELLNPSAEDLAGDLDESVSLAVRDGDRIRFVSRFTRRRTMSVAFRVGDLLPADRCAAGLVFLDPAAPCAVDDQLVQPGLIAVAVPVRDGGGEVVCALSVASHTSRHTVAGLRAHALPRLRKAAAAMEAALAGAGRRTGEGAVGRVGAGPPDVPTAWGTRAAKEELGAAYLQTLARGLAVLVALGSATGGRTPAAVAGVTGLPRATVRRAIRTLERLGYVAADGARFVLLPKVLEFGYARLSGLTFEEIVQPHLADLVARVHESASVTVLSGDDIVYVARVPTTNVMSVTISVGTRFPAYATSTGRVLLAGQERDRPARVGPRPLTRRTVTTPEALEAAVRRAAEDGYALVDQELEEGLRSIAVPIRNRTGRTVAAVNVATHAGRETPEDLIRRVLPALRETAAHMEADLAHVHATP